MKGTSETADNLQFFAEQQPILNFILIILGWFAVTVEVFLRRDFGERYFTRTKFVMGFLVLLVFKGISSFGSLMGRTMPRYDPRMGMFGQPIPEPETPAFQLGVSAMTAVIILYLVFCGYHTFRIWWRNGTGRPLHSRDHGLTWLEPLGALILAVPNFIVSLFVKLYAFTLPEREKAWLSNALPLLRDARTFTEKILEPTTLLLLALLCSTLDASAVAKWLYISTFAVILFTVIRHEMQRNQFLDIRDNMIDMTYAASAMGEDTESLRVPYGAKKALFEVATMAEKSPEAMDALRRNKPTIAGAMEALNPKLKNMGAKKDAAATDSPPPPPNTPPATNAAPQSRSAAQGQSPEAASTQQTPLSEEPKQEGDLSVEDAMRNMMRK